MRHVFFSFDWDDVWRVNQVRHSWVSKGSYTSAGFVDSAKIETLKRSTDRAIELWIDRQMKGASVTCVLIGSETYLSRWVKYEIEQSIEGKMGLLGVYIHNIRDQKVSTEAKGKSPFREQFGWKPVKSKNLSFPCCSYYDWVNDSGYDNLSNWIEKAARQAGR